MSVVVAGTENGTTCNRTWSAQCLDARTALQLYATYCEIVSLGDDETIRKDGKLLRR